MIKLSFPFSEEKIRALKVGGEVLISGIVKESVLIIYTSRAMGWDFARSRPLRIKS
jgi:hypothetical protein